MYDRARLVNCNLFQSRWRAFGVVKSVRAEGHRARVAASVRRVESPTACGNVDQMTASPRANRGPKAAAANRRALVRAAREVFAENGFDAPLNSIARAAGVGPGVLYRHFPTRESMILAVFDDNVVAIEEVANRPGTTAVDLLDFIVDQIAVSAGFIATIDPTGFDDPRLFEVSRRLVDLIGAKLAATDLRGSLRPELTAEDVVTALAMLAAVLIKTELPARQATARRAWSLLMRGLSRESGS